MTSSWIILFSGLLFYTAELQERKTFSPALRSGFYLAIDDLSKTEGVRHHNRDNYYFLKASPDITFADVKTIEKDLLGDFNGYALVFTFKGKSVRKLFEFTRSFQGQKIGLVIDNKLAYVAQIGSPIRGGVLTLTGTYTPKEVDEFLSKCRSEMQEAQQTTASGNR